MFGFRKILVGVDLTKSESSGVAALDLVAENAVRRALWVARTSRAALTFLAALPSQRGGEAPPWHVPAPGAADPPSRSPQVEKPARQALTDLVRRARDEGLTADGVLVGGQGWLELVRQVLRNRHDLLVVGTHDPHGLRRLLLGSTARKLLHECPCPVWVSKPGPEVAPCNILVASNLSPLSEDAVRLGLTLGDLAGAATHILDVVEYPLDPQWSTGLASPLTVTYHNQVRAQARQALEAQVEHSGCRTSAPPLVHVADGDGIPDHAILKFIRDHHIDLLVLGTTARHGLWGLLHGNTAERLLPEVPCSILAVKPADFHCTLQAELS